MEAIDISKARSYLKHLSRSYDEQKEEQEQKRIRLFDAKKQLHHVKEIEHELESNLQSLDARLSATMQEEQQMLAQETEEQVLSNDIRAKLKAIEEKLGCYLTAKRVKNVIDRHVEHHRKKERTHQVEQEVKMKLGKPHERVKAMNQSLESIKIHVAHLKKTHPDQERVKNVEKRILELKKKVESFEKKIKK